MLFFFFMTYAAHIVIVIAAVPIGQNGRCLFFIGVDDCLCLGWLEFAG
jgi:hypothetical protein